MQESSMNSITAWLLLCCVAFCLNQFVAHARVPDTAPSGPGHQPPQQQQQQQQQQNPDVRISVSVSEHGLVSLSCDVTGVRAGSDEHRVQFFCPLLPQGVQCFGDCSPMCTMRADGRCVVAHELLAGEAGAVACSRMSAGTAADAKTVRLTVDTRLAPMAGRWSCKFRGAASASVELTRFSQEKSAGKEKQEKKTEESRDLGATDSEEEPHDRPVLISRQQPPSDPDQRHLGSSVWKPFVPPSGRFEPGSDEAAAAAGTGETAEQGNPTLAKLARTNYVIGVLTIMTASLMLNLGFCLRCVLAKHYVELRKRDQRQPLGWLASCLCVSAVQVLSLEDSGTSGGGGGGGGGRSVPHRPDAAAKAKAEANQSGGWDQRHRQQQQQQQNQRCTYCLQPDCRILLGGATESVCACGSSACSTSNEGAAAFRPLAAAAATETGAEAEEAAAVGAEDGGVTAGGAASSEADSDQSEASTCSPDTRLELSRRMLRKADTLLREANSLLLETECASVATDQQQQQREQ